MIPITSFSLVAVCCLVLVIRILTTGRRPKGYPPGPPTLPVIGNIHQMPARDLHKKYQKWAEQYGPIFSIILGSRTLVVLSSDEAVKEILDHRSANTSSRFDNYVGGTLCSEGYRMLFQPYGPSWRMMRKLSHSLLNLPKSKSYVPYQMLENQQLLFDMLNRPHDFLNHLRRYTNSITTVIVYGWRTPDIDDPQLHQIFKVIATLSTLSQNNSAAILDAYPWTRHLPEFLLPIKAEARAAHIPESKLFLSHWLKCKESIKTGTARPCFCVDMAKTQEQEGFSDKQAAYLAGTLLEAGSETTSNELYGFVQAMVLFPEVQQKAQEELDRVVGSDRLPSMEDEPSLQYVRGCVKETLRWMPTTIVGTIPHSNMKEETYLGYTIPKDAGIVNNTYTIHYDPNRYPEPHRFNPDRFKEDFLSSADSASHKDVSKRDHFGFGAGRRICDGMHVADRSLFLAIAGLLWAFDIRPAKDDEGNDIIPDPSQVTQGFAARPLEFPANITVRSEGRAEVIRKVWQESQKMLDPETQQWKEVPKTMERR